VPVELEELQLVDESDILSVSAAGSVVVDEFVVLLVGSVQGMQIAIQPQSCFTQERTVIGMIHCMVVPLREKRLRVDIIDSDRPVLYVRQRKYAPQFRFYPALVFGDNALRVSSHK